MPTDDMSFPYRDARGTVIFDDNSKLVCGFCRSSTNASITEAYSARFSKYYTFLNPGAAQVLFEGM
jgi:hypothetical protein